MRRKLAVFIMLYFTATGAVLAQGDKVMFSAADVKADLEYLYKTLEQAHYNLYAYVGKSEFDEAYANSLNAINKDSVSLLQATKLFQKFTATGNVGHTEVDFPAQPYIQFAYSGGKVFPLELAFEDGKAYIRRSYAAHPEVEAGQQLLSIDKVPINKIQREIHPYLSAERPYYKDVKLEFWSMPRYYWSVFGEKEAFQVQVKSPEGKTQTYKVEAIPAMEYEEKRGGEITNSKRVYKVKKRVAYLNPGPFSSAEENGEEKYRAFIESAFADITSKGAKNLIVDLRNNSGGHNAYSDYLIAYFADKPFRWYSKFSLKTSKVLKEQTKRNTPEEEMDDYAQAILTHKNGEVFEYAFPMQAPVAKEKRFKGKVYVLVNRHTYSMAAVSAALIQDYGFATIVGEETGDVPTLYASQFSFPLPNTGVLVKASKGYIVRPNGDEKLVGVVPDIKVRDHLLDEKDEILDYTLDKVILPAAPR